MSKKLAVIGVGNMAKAIVAGIKKSNNLVSEFYFYDLNPSQYEGLLDDRTFAVNSISEAVKSADSVLLSVKPQNFPEVLAEIANVKGAADKLYITIAAGITVESISQALGTNNVVRVLPNLPIVISKGLSAVCYNDNVKKSDFDFVVDVFESAGSVMKIDETNMNKIICVTSSSPAYVFKFIEAIYEGAIYQGLPEDGLVEAICDMIIGSAEVIKAGIGTPANMVKAVASKGGTTERAIATLDDYKFNDMIRDAMVACTKRADELGAKK